MKKLKLNIETLRVLTKPGAPLAMAGTAATCDFYQCATDSFTVQTH